MKKDYFFKNNYIKLLLIILGFLIIVWPSYELIYIQTINQINSTSTEHRWWTYFGAFIFGKVVQQLILNLQMK